MSDSEEDNVLLRIEAAVQEAVSNLIPQKSRVAYETTYSRFEEWRSKQNVNCFNEKVMLAYFLEKSKIVKPSTLWSVYSMLRTMISINKNLDLSKYTNLIAFLKRQSEGYRAKKSKSFSKENIEKFLTTANDEDYLMQKVVLIIGITGVCRRQELLNLKVNDVEDLGEFMKIMLPITKTKVPHEFTVTKGHFKDLNLVDMVRKYATLRPYHTPHARFFINYKKGRCTIAAIQK
ncbi:unnamed protein product [Tenebrio molitor]|nr:unnamed protein product [Tenebrio molitor]